MTFLPDVAVGTVIASLIAGVVSLIGLIISKEQKVSDFRQAWIDDLRKDIALLITHANAIHGSKQVPWADISDMWKDCRSDFVGLNDATGRIRLRLNPSERESKIILDTIEEIEMLFTPGGKPDYKKINQIEKRLVSEANIVLKSEWRRVKGGEPVYRISRLSALLLVVGAIVILILISMRDFTSIKAASVQILNKSGSVMSDALRKQE